VCFIFSLNYRFDSNLNSQIKFESTQGNPNKIQMKIQLITLAKYKPKIIDGAKLNLGILGKKQEVILMCGMSTSNTNQVLEISHFAIKPILRMLQVPPTSSCHVADNGDDSEVQAWYVFSIAYESLSVICCLL
jgi:hypothetical protein